MTKNEICRLIEKIFVKEEFSVNQNLSSADIEEWDSLGHIELMNYIDNNYDNFSENNPYIIQASSITELHDFGLKDI